MALVSGSFSVMLGVRAPVPAAAAGVTPGAPYNLLAAIPISLYHVPSKIAATYYGRYDLQSIDRRSRLYDGNAYIEPRDPNSMVGLVQFYGYDQSGFKSSWFAVASDFHLVARHKLAFDLLNQAGQGIGDTLTVARTRSGDLIGTFHMDGKNYAIRWRKVGTH
jgi:hypothetical protein